MLELTVSLPQVGAVCLVITLISLLVGYAWGRSTGLKQGQRLGRRAAPIELREIALEKGTCPVCGQSPRGVVIH